MPHCFSYCLERALPSQAAGSLVVSRVCEGRMGGRAFSYLTSQLGFKGSNLDFHNSLQLGLDLI